MTWREDIEVLEMRIKEESILFSRTHCTAPKPLLEKLIAFVKDAGKAVDDAHTELAVLKRTMTLEDEAANKREDALKSQLSRTQVDFVALYDEKNVARASVEALSTRVTDLEKAQEALLRRLANTRSPFARNR